MYSFVKQSKLIATLATFVSFWGVSNFTFINSVQATAIVNGGFESGFTGWDNSGDTTVQGTFLGIVPSQDNFQAVLTTGCPDGIVGICDNRNEDQDAPQGTFNYSDNSVTQADPLLEPLLQDFLGLRESV